jgi:hypothetical protein
VCKLANGDIVLELFYLNWFSFASIILELFHPNWFSFATWQGSVTPISIDDQANRKNIYPNYTNVCAFAGVFHGDYGQRVVWQCREDQSRAKVAFLNT